MNETYRNAVVQMEEQGVQEEYILGWQGGFLGHPPREETRTNEGTGIVEAFCHYMVRGTQNWQQWIFPCFFLDFTDPTISLVFVHSLFFFFFNHFRVGNQNSMNGLK